MTFEKKNASHMRKQFYLLFFLLGFPLLLSFTTYGQQYTLTPSAGNFVPLVGGTPVDVIEDDDAISAPINIGFTFNFFGQDYTQLKVSSNGFLSFDLNEFSQSFNSIGAGAVVSNIIAPLWDDLSGAGGLSQASFSTTGTAPDRIFTMEWLNWRWDYTGPVAISFQVKLLETTNQIAFIYRQETGAPIAPSAAIGIVGNNATQFYSLVFNPSSSSPKFQAVGYNFINGKPATGQVYWFDQSFIVPVAPVTSTSNVSVSAVTSNSMNISWTNGSGSNRLVFVKQTSAIENITPVNNQFYKPSSTFGIPFSDAGNGWHCIYNGDGSFATVSNLQSGFTYRIQVVEYNGHADQQKYLSSVAMLNPIAATTLLVKPSTPVSTIALNYISHDKVQLNLSEGNGSSRAIFVKASSTGLAEPIDNTTYSADAVFGNGNQIGSSGWFCVFNGPSATDLMITGLSPGTSYKIHVVDYNGVNGTELYNATAESATATFTTFPNHPVTYNFAASAGNFTPLVGGTTIPSIQSDDNLSSAKIPLGFTFYFKGVPFTEVTPSSNGLLSFNPYVSAHGTSFFTNDLTNSLARPLLAPLWDDLDGAGGQASYFTTGTAPNRIFTIQYLNWQWDWSAANNISFQVKLYEADNKIEFIYRQEAGAVANPLASIGLAFAGTNDFASLSNSSANPDISLVSETSTIAVKPANGQVYTFTPTKLNQTITFDALTQKSFGSSTFQLTASSTSGLPISFSSTNPGVATVSGNSVTLVGAGETMIRANQSGNSIFNAAAQVQQVLTVVKGNQTISFPAIASKKYGDAAFALNASSSSGLTLVYESSNTTVATVTNNEVTIIGVGSTTITAKQSGNENYNPAVDVQQTLTVQKADQQITFASLPEKILGDAPFPITATSSSGLPVTLASSNNAIATVSANTITIIGHGIVTISASQGGNSNYNAASSVQQTLKVRANQTITFAEIPAKKIGDPNFTLTPSASSGLVVQLSTSSNKITLTNGVVSIVSPGSVTITANQSGDDIFFAAPAVSRTFCINPSKPTISVTGLGSETPVLQSSSPSNNQWFKDGVAMTGHTGSSLTATGPGLYSLKVIVDGCSSESSETESLIITGINIEQDEIRIFPNPARDRITVDVRAMNLTQEVPVVIIDLTGREVVKSTVQKSIEIDVAKLQVGNYQVLVKHGSKTISKEFVKH